MADGILVSSEIGVVGGQQDTRADVFGNCLELAFQDEHFHLPEAASFIVLAQAVQGVCVRDVNVIVVAVGFDGALDQVGGFLEAAGSKISAPENVVRAFAIGLARDGLERVADGLFVFLLGVENTGAAYQGFG